MKTRIIHWMLCALLIGPMSLPASAFARPENRVWENFSSPLKTASEHASQVVELHRENRWCGYDFASGMHKYLYAHANPVMNIDPSGNMVPSVAGSLDVLGALAARLPVESRHAAQALKALKAARALQKYFAVGVVGYGIGSIPHQHTSMEEMAIMEAKSALAASSYGSLQGAINYARAEAERRGLRFKGVVPIPSAVIPAIAAHVASAQALNPHWVVLTKAPKASHATNRADAISGAARAGQDPSGTKWSLDEYPFASSNEGGLGASVAAVPARENFMQGGIIAAAYRLQGIKSHDAFAVVVIP